jgi:predicted nuclease of restriction endonuclease-like (RecB) superfamily
MAKKQPRKRLCRDLAASHSPPAQAQAADRLLSDIRALIEQARQQVARAVNSTMMATYWRIGKRIRDDILQEQRAKYGEQIVQTLSAQLTREYGRGFSRQNLFRMIRFAEVFPDEQIVSSLMRQLSWTHLIYIIPLDDPLKRDFYAEMCRIERWSTRTLQKKIDGMLFERTALSKKRDQLIRRELDALRDEDKLTPDLVFRDPYLLGFLGLRDTYAEKDLEAAILREMEAFILELGVGFAFLERQKRITVDGDDYYLDLLFYHRALRRLVAIDLKIGDFRPADAGQMELYLRWLDEHERREDEEEPVGIILCAGKKEETVRLLDLGKRGIQVSSYWTRILPKEDLQRKLHEAVRLARERLAQQAQEQVLPAVGDKTPTKPRKGRTK